jgi:hypothetical protein
MGTGNLLASHWICRSSTLLKTFAVGSSNSNVCIVIVVYSCFWWQHSFLAQFLSIMVASKLLRLQRVHDKTRDPVAKWFNFWVRMIFYDIYAPELWWGLRWLRFVSAFHSDISTFGLDRYLKILKIYLKSSCTSHQQSKKDQIFAQASFGLKLNSLIRLISKGNALLGLELLL